MLINDSTVERALINFVKGHFVIIYVYGCIYLMVYVMVTLA